MNNNIVLISKFITVDHGKYIVKVKAKQNKTILGTALGAGETVELAEDKARERVLHLINSSMSVSQEVQSLTETPPEKKLHISPNSSPPITNQRSILADNTLTSENTISTPFFTENNDNEKEVDKLEKNLSEFSQESNVKNQEKFSNIQSDKIVSEDISLDSNNDNNKEKDINNNNDMELPLSFSEIDETLTNSEINPSDSPEAVDFSQVIDQTTIELKRLGWTQDQGKKYLLETYGKKSRHLLSDDELIEFLGYLQTQ